MSALTPERLDAILSPPKPEKLWGAPAIARALGVSVDKVRSLAANPNVPIYKPEGAGYFAFRAELEAWLKTKATASTTVNTSR
jgi:hypothetical protein